MSPSHKSQGRAGTAFAVLLALVLAVVAPLALTAQSATPPDMTGAWVPFAPAAAPIRRSPRRRRDRSC